MFLTRYKAEEFQVVAGEIDRREKGQAFTVIKLIQHEKHCDLKSGHDICLLKLNKDIVFNSKVQPIKLNTEPLGGDVTVTLSGWGKTEHPGHVKPPNILQFINLKTMTNEECSSSVSPTLNITADVLCVSTELGRGGCFGDSGSPLIFGDKLAGVASHLVPCGRGYPDIYTRISSFVDWIQKNIDDT